MSSLILAPRRPLSSATMTLLTDAVNRIDDLNSVVAHVAGDVLVACKMQNINLTIPTSRMSEMVDIADLADWFVSANSPAG